MDDVRKFRIVCFRRLLVFVFAVVCFCTSCSLGLMRLLEAEVDVVVAEQAEVVVDVVRFPPNKHKGS